MEEYAASSSVSTAPRRIKCTNFSQENIFTPSCYWQKNIRLIPISLATIMADQSITATVAVGVVAGILAIPPFLIGCKALLQRSRRWRGRMSHQDLRYIVTSIFASNIVFLPFQAQPMDLFCQHSLPGWTIPMRITKHNSSTTTMCLVSLGFTSVCTRMSTANMRVLP